MATRQVTRIVSILTVFSVMFLSGCANFMQPEIGAIARQDARIDLVADGVQNAAWTPKDLVVTYSYSESDNTFNFSGSLSFDRSLTDSFPVVRRFFLKMSFLDNEGRVLDTVDITPLLSAFGTVPDQAKIKGSWPSPAGASAIAFNYFGMFSGASQEEMGGATWEIFYFPFD